MVSGGVPFQGTHLPSDPAHHIDYMSLPSSALGWMLICSTSHVHVRCYLSCETFSMLSHAAVSFCPHAVRSFPSYSALSSVTYQRSCSSRLSRSVSDSDFSPSEGVCESYHRQQPVLSRARSSCSRRVIANFPLRRDSLLDRFSSQPTVQCSVR